MGKKGDGKKNDENDQIAGFKNSKLILFWLPVILAVIGLVGSIIQPILHARGYLYQGDDKVSAAEYLAGKELYSIDVRAYGYVENENKAIFYLDPLRLLPSHIFLGEEVRQTMYILGMRLANDAIRPDQYEYEHFRGPSPLNFARKFEFSDFRSLIPEDLSGKCLEFSIFTSSGLSSISSSTFKPSDYDTKTVRFIRDFYECFD